MISSDPPQGQPSQLPLLPTVWQETLQWQPSPEQESQFQSLYEGILAGNQQFNLTRITEPLEFWEKHLWDSLSGIRGEVKGGQEWQESGVRSQEAGGWNAAAARVIDIGTGAGFPGIPVAIARPNWTVTLLDSTRKKIDFLKQLIAELGIPNATTLVDRVESVGHHPQYRESFDLALVRAVAEAPVCAEYALPLLKTGGLAILYRGQWTAAETDVLTSAVGLLGGEIEQIESFVTPISGSQRHCLYLRKVTSTAAIYPRAIGIPVQKPLG
jgi:16S rRNA (guanine527-N7)-methyltransferase